MKDHRIVGIHIEMKTGRGKALGFRDEVGGGGRPPRLRRHH